MKRRGYLKKKVLVTSFVVVLGVAWFMIEQSKQTTYESVISSELSNDTVVEKVRIEDMLNHKWTESTSDEVIHNIRKKPRSMEMKETNKTPSVEYIITLKTEESSYHILLGKECVDLDDGIYQVKGKNELYDFIKSAEFNWENKQ